MDLRESREPVRHPLCAERVQIRQFSFQRSPLRRKFEIIVDSLPQQAGQKTERQSLQRSQIIRHQLPRLRRVAVELFRFELAWRHGATTPSFQAFMLQASSQKLREDRKSVVVGKECRSRWSPYH